MVCLSGKMTIKQKKFADEYIISGNATKAAIEAGYSKKYANTNASKLLQNTTIKEYVNKRLKEDNNCLLAHFYFQHKGHVFHSYTTEKDFNKNTIYWNEIQSEYFFSRFTFES